MFKRHASHDMGLPPRPLACLHPYPRLHSACSVRACAMPERVPPQKAAINRS